MDKNTLMYKEIVYEEAGMCVYALNKEREQQVQDLLSEIIVDGQMTVTENKFLTELLRIFTNITDLLLDDEELMNVAIENPSMEFSAVVSEVMKINTRYVRILKNNTDTLTNIPQEALAELIGNESKKAVEDEEYRKYLELQEKFGER